MTRAELRERLSMRELQQWLILEAIEPFGERAAYWRSGLICATIANVNRDPKKTLAFKAKDFMPDFSNEQAREMNLDEAFEWFDRMAKKDEELRLRIETDASFTGN